MRDRRTRGVVVGAVALGIAIAAGLAQSYSTSPPLRGSGAPGEPDETQCIHCHLGHAVNFGSGTLILTAPPTYAPAHTYDLTVSLAQADKLRWGYQLTVLGTGDGFVGSLSAGSSTTSEIPVDVQTGISFANHTDDGTFPGATSAMWTVQWTSPISNVGAVTVYVSGVAANKNFLSTGDDVYTTSVVIPFSTAVEPATWGAIKQLYRAR